MTEINRTANPGSQAYVASVNVMQRFGASLNIPEMGLLVQMERHNILQDQVMDQFKDMENRNAWLRDATAVLNAVRAQRPQKDGADNGVNLNSFNVTYHDATGATVTKTADQFFKDNGIPIPPGKDGKLSQVDFDTAINNLKSSIDTANTNSQMDMVRMQGLMDKMNQAIDFMTNWTAKNSKTIDSITGNIR